jgi:hypothetical protein
VRDDLGAVWATRPLGDAQHGHARTDRGGGHGLDLAVWRVPEGHRKVGRADQHAGDARHGEDRVRGLDRRAVLDLDDHAGLLGGTQQVVLERGRAVTTGARRQREAAPAARRVVRGRHRGLGSRGVEHVRDDDAVGARVQRAQDRRRIERGDAHERRDPDRRCGAQMLLERQGVAGAVLGVQKHDVETSVPRRFDLRRARQLREQRRQRLTCCQPFRERVHT